jgi:tRNA nucleotidyltransferase (CCA-adding enzyme)
LHQAPQMKPSTLLEFLVELDAIRQPARFKDFLKACEADSRGRTGFENCATPAADLMLKVLEAASSVDAGAIASAYSEPEKIKAAVFEARLKAVKLAL